MYKIIFENDNFLIIDKLSQIPCIRLKDKAGLSDELILEFPSLSNLPDYGFTHRIDNDTLGLVIVAKNINYYNKIRDLFKQNKILKVYHARVSGKLYAKKGIINYPIAHSKKTDKKMVAIKEGYRLYRGKAREAETRWTLISGKDLEVIIKTGVRHQIRVHLASLSHPILGDFLYNGDPAPCLMLISKKISFSLDGENFEAVSSLNLDDLLKV